jgi:phosphoglycolate phosphatase-like HAD superfamily hydrolase
MRLVLFDVDGTLLHCGPQVRPLFAAALEEVFGTAGAVESYSFAGKTDPRIVLDLMTGAGVPGTEVHAALPRVREVFLERLAAGLDPAGMTLLPGVVDLLDRLAATSGVALGLLTGNWRRGAEIKLAPFGLGRYFPFGAFGDDGIERSELPPVAMARAAAATGRRFRAEDVLIVGDSAEDVACARAHGVDCLAVATGWTTAADLAAAGAAWVAADLPAAEALGCFAAARAAGAAVGPLP